MEHRGGLEHLGTMTSPDGEPLLVTCGDGLRPWRLNGQAAGDAFADEAERMVAMRLPDGRPVLATSEWRPEIHLWDADLREPIGPTLTGHTDRVTALAAVERPGGPPVLVTGSADTTVRVWDLALIGRYSKARGFRPTVAMAAVTLPDGRGVLALGGEDSVQLWDPAAGGPVGATLRAPGVQALAAVPRPDGTDLLAVGDPDDVYLCDPLARAGLDSRLFQDIGEVETLAAFPAGDGKVHIAVGGTRYSTLFVTGGGVLVRLYGAADGERKPGFNAEMHVTTLATLPGPEGRARLVLASKHSVKVWDPVTLTLVDVDVEEPDGDDPIVAMTAVPVPGGRHALAVARTGGTVHLLAPDLSRVVATLPTGIPIAAAAAAGDCLAVAGRSGMAIFRLDGAELAARIAGAAPPAATTQV
jgi:WD40 repeat protein